MINERGREENKKGFHPGLYLLRDLLLYDEVVASAIDGTTYGFREASLVVSTVP